MICFLGLPAHDQAVMLRAMPQSERRLWFHLLPPDDAADVIQEYPEDERAGVLALIDEAFRVEKFRGCSLTRRMPPAD